MLLPEFYGLDWRNTMKKFKKYRRDLVDYIEKKLKKLKKNQVES